MFLAIAIATLLIGGVMLGGSIFKNSIPWAIGAIAFLLVSNILLEVVL